MGDLEARRIAGDELQVIRTNLDSFKESLLTSLSAATDPITPKVAFKLLVYRESLFWRLIELASGAVDTFENGNFLSGLVVTRAVQESAAANHFFHRTLEKCIFEDSVEKLDGIVMKLLLGARWEEHEHQSINVLTMIDKADKLVTGFRRTYDNLSEYAHPNYSGNLLCFSMHESKFDIKLGKYPRGEGRHFLIGTTSLTASLMLFEHDYNRSAEILPKIIELCQRDLEQNV